MKPDAAVHGGGASGSISRDPCRVLLVSDDPAELRLIRSLFDDCAQIGTPLGPIALDSAGDYRQAAILTRDFDYGAILLGRLGEPARADAVLRRARVEHGLPGPFLVLVDKPCGSEADSVPAAGAADILAKDGLTAALLERAVRYAIELHAAQTRIAGLELSDAATGLARQPLFWEVLSLAVRRGRRNKDYLAVLMVHLDCLEQPSGLPGIDPLGAVVPLVVQRLSRVLRACDTIALLDDGHLAVLVESMPRAEDIQTVAEKIIATTTGHYEASDRLFSLAVNLGIALFPTSAGDPGGLLRAAAVATLASREKGVNGFHFG